MNDAVISPIAPLAAAEFLSHDKLKGADDVESARKALADQYVENEASAFVAAAKGAVDAVVTADEVRDTVINAVEIMAGKRISRLPKKHGNMPI